MEKEYPDLLNLLSTCKSPQEMFGSISKNYFAPNVINNGNIEYTIPACDAVV